MEPKGKLEAARIVPVYEDPISEVLVEAKKQGASDIDIIQDYPPTLKIQGKVQILRDFPEIQLPHIEAFLGEENYEKVNEGQDLDFAYSLQKDDIRARFRVNAYRSTQGIGMTFRIIPETPPTLEKLGLPNFLRSLVERPDGLILVTGPTGSGKSTTLAALIRHLNETKAIKIITIEDPIEYIHPQGRALVVQRQVGRDVASFFHGLRSALRQAPDVILVGEIRDKETMELALTAAETGHLVLGTLHARRASRAVERILSFFPADQRDAIRSQVAGSLTAVIVQRLIPIPSGGRALAYEIMVNNTAIANLIREGKDHHIDNEISNRQDNMVPFEFSLAQLVKKGFLPPEMAYQYAENISLLKSFI